MGSRYGVDDTYIQRIMAAQISSTLRGFGYALSGPMDLDENEYPGTVNCFMFHLRPQLCNIHFIKKNL